MARPRKPTELKVITGTFRQHRAAPDAPKPPKARPVMPSGLSDRGKTAWREAAGMVERMGVLTLSDPVALAELAETVADLRSARASLGRPLLLPADREGNVGVAAKANERYYWTEGRTGWMRRSRPEVADIADASRRLAMWIARFGLSPADRSRVSTVHKTGTTNPFADLDMPARG